MSKKIVKHKTARFALEPDGFSIHTFELSRRLKSTEYYAVKDLLYHQQEQSDGKPWIYKDGYGNHICVRYSDHGISSIKLKHNKSADTYFLRMVVNPRKLIDPKSSYIGILPPEKSSIKALKKAFVELFEGTVFENDINVYQLTRVDLCTNIRCDNKKLFRELVRVLRKLPTPPKYERKRYKGKDKKAANRYNKHYLRFSCGTHELVIYDKTYQVENCGLAVSYEKLPEGVLRFEIHCEREYLRKVERHSGQTDTDKLLWQLMQESEERIIRHFSQCFSDARFVQMEEIERLVAQSAFREENKDSMMALASSLQRTQSVDKALEKMEKAGYDTTNLLERFDKLGISPIPLWKNFCAKELPGPVKLLRGVSDGELPVEYLKIKQK